LSEAKKKQKNRRKPRGCRFIRSEGVGIRGFYKKKNKQRSGGREGWGKG